MNHPHHFNFAENIVHNIETLRAKENRRLIERLQKEIQVCKKENVGLKNENGKLKEQNGTLIEEHRKLKSEILVLTNENEALKKLNQAPRTNLGSFFKNDEIFKDFKVLIDDREFYVHKMLLAAKSPTLADMLKNNPDAENLNLDGISIDIFEKVLNYFYTDELPCGTDGNFLELFAVAGRLKIEELLNFAAQNVIEKINEGNSLMILKLGSKYEHAEMTQKAFEQVMKNHPKIKFRSEWLENAERVEKLIEYIDELEKLEKKFGFADMD